jgi:hypothetical protein
LFAGETTSQHERVTALPYQLNLDDGLLGHVNYARDDVVEDRTFVNENAFSLDDPVGVPEHSEDWS